MVHGLGEIETKAPPVSIPDAGGVLSYALALINRVVVVLASIALLVASCVLTYSVVGRYFLHIPTEWQDELSVFLIVGAVFMSGAAVQARRGHIGIEAIAAVLSPRVNRIRQYCVDVATLVFCAFFAWKSWILLEEAITEGFHSGSSWGPPLWIPYSLMTVGMVLLSLQLLLQVIAPLQKRRAGI